MNLDEYLREYRVNLSKLARDCNVSPSTIWRIQQGTMPTLPVAQQLVKMSEGKITYDELVYYSQNMKMEGLVYAL